ncbi:MAG TPA: phosphodiester glycosidase family protein [Sandaracinaceae bacterium]
MRRNHCTAARFVRLASLVFCLAASSVAAQEIPRRLGDPIDVWTEPNPGVRYLHRTIEEPPVSIHALVVDLRAPGVRVVATPHHARWSTVSDFARSQGAAAAINGGFWSLWQRPTGITAGGGELWPGAEPDPEFGHFGVRRDGRAVVHGPGEGEDPRSLRQLTDSVSGRPLLVVNGQVARDVLDAFPTANHRQPRTAAGVSRDGRTVVLAVADGRQGHSRGLTLYQLARLMIELGAHRAINLDGGGSSVMYVAREGGIVSSPSRGRWVSALGLDDVGAQRVRTRHGEREVYVRGVEREVMNHLAVIAPGPPAAVASAEVTRAAEPAAPAPRTPRVAAAAFVPPPRPPLRVGAARELLVPALWIGAPLFVLAAPLGLWRLKRARLRAAALLSARPRTR